MIDNNSIEIIFDIITVRIILIVANVSKYHCFSDVFSVTNSSRVLFGPPR